MLQGPSSPNCRARKSQRPSIRQAIETYSPMPLSRYFGFAGTALLMLLLVSHWLLPESTAEPVRSGIDKTVIRISSIEKPPEKVVFDTSLPAVVPPSSVALPPRIAAVAAPPVQSAFAFVQITPGPLPGFAKARYVIAGGPDTGTREVARPNHDKGYSPKKVTGHRTRPPLNLPATRAQPARAPEPVTRLSLIDVIKDRLSRRLF